MKAPIATELIRDAVVWDNHACMPLRVEEEFLPQLARHKQAGFTAVTLNVGYDQNHARRAICG